MNENVLQNSQTELIHYLDPNLCAHDVARMLLNRSVAIITPSDVFVEKILFQAQKLGEIDMQRIGIYSSNMTETARARFWIDAVSGKYNALI